jgi:hypothetical protein
MDLILDRLITSLKMKSKKKNEKSKKIKMHLFLKINTMD